MTGLLSRVKSGKIDAPTKILVYGVEGVGKSTFASGAESPIFVGRESETEQLDIKRIEPKSWAETLAIIDELASEEHPYRTLVIDTLDWLEPILWEHVCRQNGWKTLEDPGYGKGPAAALQEWRVLLSRLESLRNKSKMHILLIGHSEIRTFRNPEAEDYDRYQLKLQPKAGSLIKEWCDCVLFAEWEAHTFKKDNRAKGILTGARVLRTERHASYDAKNRYGLPPQVLLSFEEFEKARKSNDALVTNLEELLGDDSEKRQKVMEWVEGQPDRSVAISQAVNRLKQQEAING